MTALDRYRDFCWSLDQYTKRDSREVAESTIQGWWEEEIPTFNHDPCGKLIEIGMVGSNGLIIHHFTVDGELFNITVIPDEDDD